MSRARQMVGAELEALSKGFDAGSADNAYVSENFDRARAGRKPRAHPRAWWCGYVLGFFSTYEDHEVPAKWRGLVITTRRKCGPSARAAGIAL